MATAIRDGACLWITDIGCGVTRRTLLGLEPGSCIWMSLDGQPQLFERMADDPHGASVRAMMPVAGRGTGWSEAQQSGFAAVGLEMIERPVDQGAGDERHRRATLPQDNKDLEDA